ncbi:MAG: tripartite tricarboxylate transporter TctB family protein [Peptococcaceae bacterium]|nr:tripartite tricarboxylate transporter TctB family protein [Peptococcaceae bacterium]
MEQGLRKKLEIGFGLLIFAFFALFFILGLGYPPRPRELPLMVDVLGLLLTGYHLVSVVRRPASVYKKPSRPLNWRAIVMSSGSMLVYLISTYFFGMTLSSFIIVYGCGLAYGAKKKKTLVIVAAAAVVVVYLLFEMALKVRLYPGIVFGG